MYVADEDMKRGGRRLDVDALRLLAAFFVVVYHFGVFSSGPQDALFPNVYVRSLLSCCVPIFFLITGVLYSSRPFAWRKAMSKLCKLFALTLAWGLLLWPVHAAQRGIEFAPGPYLSGVLTLQQGVINHLWFLPQLAIVYLLIPLFQLVRERSRNVFDAFVMASLVFVFVPDLVTRVAAIAGGLLDTGILSKGAGFLKLFNPLGGYHDFSIAYVLLGMWLGSREVEPRAVKLAPAGILMGPLVMAVYAFVRMPMTGESVDPTFGGYACVGTLVVTVSFYLLFNGVCGRIDARGLLGRAIAFMGVNSFGVYLLHMLFKNTFWRVVPTAGPFAVRVFIDLLLCLVVVAVCATASHLMQKTHLGRWLLRV